MKKFLCLLMLCVMLISMPLTAFAGLNDAGTAGNVLGSILSDIIIDTLKKNGMGDILGGKEASGDTAPKEDEEKTEMPKLKTSSTGEIIELSKEQYQSFSEICLAGSFEEFQKKIEYEKISPDAQFTKEDGSVITLLELASSSPNKELAAYLKGMKAKEEKGEK